MLREGFEAAFVVSIIHAYLIRTGRRGLCTYVWYGAAIAVAMSVAVGSLAWLAYGSISKPVQALFEGAAALLAVSVLSYMIFWMATKGKEIKTEIQRRVEVLTTFKTAIGLTSLAFTVVFREGLESVLFLIPFLVSETLATILGSLLGAFFALILAYGIFTVGMKIDIRRFFYFTSVLLVLLAGGLAGLGVHELVEYSGLAGTELGWIADYAYTMEIPSTSLFHHKGIVGSILAVMFGYTVRAEWGRVIVHLAYLAIVLPLVGMTYRRK